MNMQKIPKGRGVALGIFFILFFCAICISLVLRAFSLIQNASFTGDSFTVLVASDRTHIVRLDTDQNTVSVLEIASVGIDGKNLVLDGMKIGVPINASILIREQSVENVIDEVFSTPMSLSCLVRGCGVLNRMNAYDRVKFAFAVRKIPVDNITQRTIDNYTHDFAIQRQITDELYELFRDPAVVNEQTSVQVINASDVPGVATQVSSMLEHGGYTVVAVDSAETQLSRIEVSEESNQSIEYLKQIFAFPIKKGDRSAIADVTVVIGQDLFK